MDDRLAALITEQWPELTVEDILGRGTYATVYRCRHISAATDFTSEEAVKVVEIEKQGGTGVPVGISEDEWLEELKNKAVDEIRIMIDLSSSHVMHINDYKVLKPDENRAGYCVLIRMECMHPLAADIHSAETMRLDEAEAYAKKVGLDICEALLACERQDVLHRDIKPENILCNRLGDYFLSDFGIARDMQDAFSGKTPADVRPYTAPEAMGTDYDARADQYSLGLILYQIVNHGRFPFTPAYPDKLTAMHFRDAINKRCDGEPLPRPNNCGDGLADVILKMCSFSKEERFSGAEEIIRAIRKLEYFGDVEIKDKGNDEDEDEDEDEIKDKIDDEVKVKNEIKNKNEDEQKKNRKSDHTTQQRLTLREKLLMLKRKLLMWVERFRPIGEGKFRLRRTVFYGVLTGILILCAALGIHAISEKAADGTPVRNGTPLYEVTSYESNGYGFALDLVNSVGVTFPRNTIYIEKKSNSTDKAFVTFALSKDYRQVSFDVSCDNDSDNVSGEILVYTDDDRDNGIRVKLDRTADLTRVDIPTARKNTLTVELIFTERDPRFSVLLSDAYAFERRPKPKNYGSTGVLKNPVSEQDALHDLFAINSRGYSADLDRLNTIGLTYPGKNITLQKRRGSSERAYVTYALHGMYKTVILDCSCENGSDNVQADLLFYTDDDRDHAQKATIDLNAQVKRIVIPTEGKQRLTVELNYTEYDPYVSALITDAFAFTDEKTESAVKSTGKNLRDVTNEMHVYDLFASASRGYSVDEDLRNSIGYSYPGKSIRLRKDRGTPEKAFVTFALNGEYRTVVLDCSCEFGSDDAQADLLFYTDDDRDGAQKARVERYSGVQRMAIDVKGKQRLTVELNYTERDPMFSVLLTDAYAFTEEVQADTVGFTGTPVSEVRSDTYLHELFVTESRFYRVEAEQVNANGIRYPEKSLLLARDGDSDQSAYVTYALNGFYHTVVLDYSCAEDADDTQAYLLVYTDGDRIHAQQFRLDRHSEAGRIVFPVADKQRLTLELAFKNTKGRFTALITDAHVFTGEAKEADVERTGVNTAEPKNNAALYDLFVSRAAGYTAEAELEDAGGTAYPQKSVCLRQTDPDAPAFVTFALNKAYKRISLRALPGGGSEEGEATLLFYADGDRENGVKYTIASDAGAQEIELPLENVMQLTVELTAKELSQFSVLLTDAYVFTAAEETEE